MKLFKRILLTLFTIIFISVAFSVFNIGLININTQTSNNSYNNSIQQNDVDSPQSPNSSFFNINNNQNKDNSSFEVFFLNVGNADCEFIDYVDNDKNHHTFLIDGGEASSGSLVKAFINELGFYDIDFYIGTHPHSDHIGCAEFLIKEFNIKNIYMPKIPDNYVPTTIFYKNLLTMFSETGLKVTSPEVGYTLFHSDDLVVNFLNSSNNNTFAKNDMNGYSLALAFIYKNKNVLYTAGDAVIANEQEIINTWADSLKNFQIFKASHHCSNSSNSEELLNLLKPKYSYIPVSSDNTYGHPHEKSLNHIKDTGAQIFYANLDSTVSFFTTDGVNFDIKTNLTEGLY